MARSRIAIVALVLDQFGVFAADDARIAATGVTETVAQRQARYRSIFSLFAGSYTTIPYPEPAKMRTRQRQILTWKFKEERWRSPTDPKGLWYEE